MKTEEIDKKQYVTPLEADIKASNGQLFEMKPTTEPLYEKEKKALELMEEYEKKSKKRKKTGGETLVERGIFFPGIGFSANEAISLYLTDEVKSGWGKELYHKAAEGLANKLPWAFKTGYNKKGKLITGHDKAANTLMTLMLLSGGTILLWPMKILQDNKQSLVRGANHFFDWLKGVKDPQFQLERDVEVEKAIACEPVQSWRSLLIGRVIAMVSTLSLTAFMGPERVEEVEKWTEENTLGRLKTLNEKGIFDAGPLGKYTIGPTKPNKSIQWFTNESARAPRYARLIGVETICCTLSSVVLEVFSKIFAKKSKVLFEEKKCQELSTESAPKSDAESAPKDSYKKPCATMHAETVQANGFGHNLEEALHTHEHKQHHKHQHRDDLRLKNDDSYALGIAKQHQSMDSPSLPA